MENIRITDRHPQSEIPWIQAKIQGNISVILASLDHADGRRIAMEFAIARIDGPEHDQDQPCNFTKKQAKQTSL